MAPRTKEQQIAYNTKRRAETAAKKDPVKHDVATKATPKRNGVAKRRAGKSPHLAAPYAPKPEVVKPEVAVSLQTQVRALAKAVTPKPKHDLAKQVKALGADSLLPPPKPPRVTNATRQIERVTTMPLSYVRNGSPGGGMKRGANFQATVTFTPDQFAELRDKALFNNRSLAEQIRWCVIQQLKTVA